MWKTYLFGLAPCLNFCDHPGEAMSSHVGLPGSPVGCSGAGYQGEEGKTVVYRAQEAHDGPGGPEALSATCC